MSETAPPTPWSELDDEELAAAVAGVGDVDAFTALATRHLPGILRYLRRMGPADEAEDLAQEVLLGVWRGLPDFQFRSSVRTWIFSLAHRKVVDYYRRRKEVAVTDDVLLEVPDHGSGPAEASLGTSLAAALNAELNQLPYVSRSVWWLREIEGLSLGEIGQALHISEGSVRGHLQRSRHRLAERLAPWQPGAAEPAGKERTA